MANKAKVLESTGKGPPMILVLHDGVPTWANRTKSGYRCTKCKAESHDKAPDRR